MTLQCGLTTHSTLPTVLSVQHRCYYCQHLRYIKKYSRFIIPTISCSRYFRHVRLFRTNKFLQLCHTQMCCKLQWSILNYQDYF